MPKRGANPTMICRLIIVATLAGLPATALSAPTVLDSAQVAREFTQRSWRQEDGLPDNRVRTILQTRDGYLWIGTQRGLARFDGQKFTVFDHGNTPGMTNEDCHALVRPLGAFWNLQSWFGWR